MQKQITTKSKYASQPVFGCDTGEYGHGSPLGKTADDDAGTGNTGGNFGGNEAVEIGLGA